MKKQNTPSQGCPAKTTDTASISEIDVERRDFEAIRQARSARLEALNLTTPAPFDVTIALARAVASAERAVREFVRGQVAA